MSNVVATAKERQPQLIYAHFLHQMALTMATECVHWLCKQFQSFFLSVYFYEKCTVQKTITFFSTSHTNVIVSLDANTNFI